MSAYTFDPDVELEENLVSGTAVAVTVVLEGLYGELVVLVFFAPPPREEINQITTKIPITTKQPMFFDL